MIKNDKIPELERTSEAGLPTFATSGQYKAYFYSTRHLRALLSRSVGTLSRGKKFKRHVSFMNKLIRLAFYL